ncbi:MAG: hypothetical protein WAU68_14770 [Vitreimonas sp.]
MNDLSHADDLALVRLSLAPEAATGLAVEDCEITCAADLAGLSACLEAVVDARAL